MREPDSSGPAGPCYDRERLLIAEGLAPIAGIDEAGRGPLAGPVVAAAVVLDPDAIPDGLDDSKRLTPERRDELFDEIAATARFAVAVATVSRIDRDNIHHATLWAMAKACRTLAVRPAAALIDGRHCPKIACETRAVIGGDGLSQSIAAASIIAKVTRDRLMIRLARRFPLYGFERHKGYSTPEHLDALARLGPTPHHRRSFAPVRELLPEIAAAG